MSKRYKIPKQKEQWETYRNAAAASLRLFGHKIIPNRKKSPKRDKKKVDLADHS